MNTEQPEALPALIERFRGLHIDHAPDGWPAVRTREITALLDRITELEAQLAQRFDAADMATAAAQGFRGGVTSAPHGQAPAGTTEPTEQQILEAAEKAGLWPNTVHSWIPAFHRYHKELAKAQPAQAQADSWQEDAARLEKLVEAEVHKQDTALIRRLVEALVDLVEAGEDAWGDERPCVRIGKEEITAARTRLEDNQ